MPPLLVTRKLPPADVIFPVIVGLPIVVSFKFSSVLVCAAPAAPKLMSPVMLPVAVDASVMRLPPPTEAATLPAGAPVTVIAPSLLMTLAVPAERMGAAAPSVVPLTVTPGRLLMVSWLIDDWNPLVSAVAQVTVSLVAFMRQSANAAEGVTK